MSRQAKWAAVVFVVVGAAAQLIRPQRANPPTDASRTIQAQVGTTSGLVAVLATHHHFDHVGGNPDLLAAMPTLRVYGSAGDASRIPGVTPASITALLIHFKKKGIL